MPKKLDIDNLDNAFARRMRQQDQSTEAEHQKMRHQTPSAETDSSFREMAAELRARTKRRQQTPSEILLRESRSVR